MEADMFIFRAYRSKSDQKVTMWYYLNPFFRNKDA